MANFFPNFFLVATLQLTFTTVYAFNGQDSFEKSTVQFDYCDAQAPDNFQVVSIGSDLVSLGWIPAWPGAIQTLELSVENSGNWVPIFSENNVLGASYTLNELNPGYYKAKIRTNCPSGEASSLYSEVLFDFKIIDLSTAGRIPKDPVVVEDCENIDYLKHEWVGFKVTKIATGLSNIFEFKFIEGQGPSIKRVLYDSPIVAVNYNGIFPTSAVPNIKAFTPFRMDDKNAENPDDLINIGFVLCFEPYLSIPIITLCKDENNPIVSWKPEYSFAAMTAESVTTDYPPNSSVTDKTVQNALIYDKIKVQSPFKESLNIFFPQIFSEGSMAKIRLFNTNGQRILSFSFDLNSSQISIPISSILPGIYILQIETDFEVQVFKVEKSE
jgi:hypothetical protein